MSEITLILSMIESGDQKASEQLLPLVYDELRRLAAARMASERSDHTLQATALVHEAYLRLVDVAHPQQWNGRGHFFAAAAEAMRRILVEDARRKTRRRHGGEGRRLQVEIDHLADQGDNLNLLAVSDLLDRLGEKNQILADIVKLRCFVGFSIC